MLTNYVSLEAKFIYFNLVKEVYQQHEREGLNLLTKYESPIRDKPYFYYHPLAKLVKPAITPTSHINALWLA